MKMQMQTMRAANSIVRNYAALNLTVSTFSFIPSLATIDARQKICDSCPIHVHSRYIDVQRPQTSITWSPSS